VHVKRVKVDAQKCASNTVHRVTEGIDFHQSMQPGGQSFIYREEGAGKEKKRKNQKGGNDLEPFQTFQERTQGQAQRHQGDRRDEQDQQGRWNTPGIYRGKKKRKRKQNGHLEQDIGASPQHFSQK